MITTPPSKSPAHPPLACSKTSWVTRCHDTLLWNISTHHSNILAQLGSRVVHAFNGLALYEGAKAASSKGKKSNPLLDERRLYLRLLIGFYIIALPIIVAGFAAHGVFTRLDELHLSGIWFDVNRIHIAYLSTIEFVTHSCRMYWRHVIVIASYYVIASIKLMC